MFDPRNPIHSKYIFGFIPTLPSVLFGSHFIWQQGFSVANASIIVLLIVFSGLCGFLLWSWHIEQLSQCQNRYQKSNKAEVNKLLAYVKELEKMLQSVSPKIFEQVVAARELTEQEISILIRRFTGMLDELQQIIEFVNQASNNSSSPNVENLRKNAEQIRGEIDIVLEALQFQDRVSQILVLVEENLATLRTTVEKIQRQGNDRDQNMLKVDEMLGNIQTKYETVNHLRKRASTEHVADELTFF
jgi:hypothetical protein